MKSDIAAIDLGDSHLIILTKKGEVMTYGNNYSGELGYGDDQINISRQYKPILNLMGAKFVFYVNFLADNWALFCSF